MDENEESHLLSLQHISNSVLTKSPCKGSVDFTMATLLFGIAIGGAVCFLHWGEYLPQSNLHYYLYIGIGAADICLTGLFCVCIIFGWKKIYHLEFTLDRSLFMIYSLGSAFGGLLLAWEIYAQSTGKALENGTIATFCGVAFAHIILGVWLPFFQKANLEGSFAILMRIIVAEQLMWCIIKALEDFNDQPKGVAAVTSSFGILFRWNAFLYAFKIAFHSYFQNISESFLAALLGILEKPLIKDENFKTFSAATEKWSCSASLGQFTALVSLGFCIAILYLAYVSGYSPSWHILPSAFFRCSEFGLALILLCITKKRTKTMNDDMHYRFVIPLTTLSIVLCTFWFVSVLRTKRDSKTVALYVWLIASVLGVVAQNIFILFYLPFKSRLVTSNPRWWVYIIWCLVILNATWIIATVLQDFFGFPPSNANRVSLAWSITAAHSFSQFLSITELNIPN